MTSQDPPRRRWFQFRLRTLLIVMTLCAILFAWINGELERERQYDRAIAWIERKGGTFKYHATQPAIPWWRERVRDGLDATVLSVREVRLGQKNVSDLSLLVGLEDVEVLDFSDTQVIDLAPLAELKKLKMIYLDNTQVRDLSPLAELTKLTHLYLNGTPVSDEQVQTLQESLPECQIER